MKICSFIILILVLTFTFEVSASELPPSLWGGIVWEKTSEKGFYAECTDWQTTEQNSICQNIAIFQFKANQTELQSYQFNDIKKAHQQALSIEELAGWFSTLTQKMQSSLEMLLARDRIGEVKKVKDSGLSTTNLTLLFDYSIWPGTYQFQSPVRPAYLVVESDLSVNFSFSHPVKWLRNGEGQFIESNIRYDHTDSIHFSNGHLIIPVLYRPLGTYMAPTGRAYFELNARSAASSPLGEVAFQVGNFILKDISILQLKRVR